ncbi:MAG: DUF1801 domain-containing protein [Puia sp.]|nr:DUF1801 domain-containing protein [Puia sp.]
MVEEKAKPTERSVGDFINGIADPNVRKDCFSLIAIMEKVTGFAPVMWGSSIVGFGKYHYRYESGHEGDCCITGFSPRKQNLSLYVMAGFPGQADLLKKIGKHKAGKGCLYIRGLKDIDAEVLESLIRKSIDFTKKKIL